MKFISALVILLSASPAFAWYANYQCFGQGVKATITVLAFNNETFQYADKLGRKATGVLEASTRKGELYNLVGYGDRDGSTAKLQTPPSKFFEEQSFSAVLIENTSVDMTNEEYRTELNCTAIEI
jgi:hypothetical protein